MRRQKGNLANWHSFGGGQLLIALVVPPEMQICTSVLTEPAPYVLADPAADQYRLLCHTVVPGTHLGALRLGDVGQPARHTSLREASRSISTAWAGQTWTGVRWPNSSWNDTRELIGAAHQTLS